MIRKIIISIIALPLLIVPLFCCCVQQVEAAATDVDHCQSSDDHSATQEHADHNSSHTCDCHSFSTAAENATTINIAFLSFPNSFHAIDVLAFRSASYIKTSMRLAYLGPPLGKSSKVPLYIQQHSLRI